MIEGALGTVLGAFGRRLIGWDGAPRWQGLVVAVAGVLIVMLPHGLWPALVAAAAVSIGWGLPWHGESLRAPWWMSLRNGALTAAIAAVLALGYGLAAWWYAPLGLGADAIYWFASRMAPDGDADRFIGDWNAWAELGLGALLVGGLATVGG